MPCSQPRNTDSVVYSRAQAQVFLFKFPGDFNVCPRWRISALYNSFQKFPDVIRDEGLLIMVSFPAQVITHFTWKAAMLTTIPPTSHQFIYTLNVFPISSTFPANIQNRLFIQGLSNLKQLIIESGCQYINRIMSCYLDVIQQQFQ